MWHLTKVRGWTFSKPTIPPIMSSKVKVDHDLGQPRLEWGANTTSFFVVFLTERIENQYLHFSTHRYRISDKAISHHSYRVSLIFFFLFSHRWGHGHKLHCSASDIHTYATDIGHGIETYFLSMSTVFQPGIGTDTRHWHQYRNVSIVRLQERPYFCLKNKKQTLAYR